MLDRQKLETVLANRFPGAAMAQLAAAANAIMGLADDDGCRADAPVRRRPVRVPRNPLTRVLVSVWINAPLARVFDLFTDVEHASEHVSAIAAVEMLSVGPFGLGARWRESRRILRRLDTAEMEVTSFERYRTYTISHHKGGIGIETVFAFEAAGDCTHVTIEFGLDGGGLPPGFLTPLSWAIAGKVRRLLEHDLTDLKRHLEGARVSA